MSTRQQLDRISQIAVPSDRTVMITIEAHDLGQHVRVTGVTLRPEVECRCRYRAADSGLIANT